MTIRTIFQGTPAYAAPFNFGMVSQQKGRQGIILGTNLQTGEPFIFDPWLEKSRGTVDALIGMGLGAVGHGKTSLAKVMALRFAGLGMGEERLRIWLGDARRNDGVPEYARLIEAFDAEPIRLSEYSLNLLDPDMGLRQDEVIALITTLCQLIVPQFLDDMQRLALRVGYRKYTHYEHNPNLAGLARTLSTLEPEDVMQYQDLESKNMDSAHFRSSAMIVAMRIDDALASFGGLFAGEKPISTLLSQNIVGIDYTGISKDALELVQSIMWQWKTSALDRGDMRYFPHFEIHDENYTNWAMRAYATYMYDYIKQVRKQGAYIHMVTHRLEDLMSVGESNSNQRQLAANILNDVTIWFIGRQPIDVVSSLQRRLNFSDRIAQTIVTLGKGDFVYKLGDLEPIVFHLDLTPFERTITESDQAATRLAARR